MPSWWSKSSSKGSNEKSKKGSLINTIQKKFRIVSEGKCKSGSGSSKKHSDAKHALIRPPLSPYMQASLCNSFAERPQPLPLPLPGPQHSAKHRANSGKKEVAEAEVSKGSQPVLFSPLPKPPNRPDPVDAEAAGGTSSVSSDKSTDVDNPPDSRLPSPHASGYKNAKKAALNSSSSVTKKNQSPNSMGKNIREMLKPTDTILNNQVPTSHKPGRASSYVPNLQIPHHGTSFCAPDSTMCSPSRSSVRAGKPCADLPMLEYGHCSSPGSGHNSVGGDLARFSPQCSPIASPRMTRPRPSSRIHSEVVTPLHPRAGGTIELPAQWPDGNHQGHRLPLPPINISDTNHSYATETTLVPRSPSRVKNPTNCGPRWMKGKLLGRGTFGHVYLGFNSENGEMCAMKEVTLLSDDAKSKESAQQLGQEIALLSCLRHPNIVQYLGSELVDDKLYIYLEYVSGGSIYKILQDFKLHEAAIRRFTQQILFGLAYLHDRHTIHRDIKAANLLLEPNGCVKLADFGMAKHISDESYKLSFKGSSYWMAPEIILNNSNGRNLTVDIWSLGCTVWEMATGKPPWSELEAVAALYKIGYSEKLPEIPQHLSDDGKDFIRQCLQRNPLDRPSAAQLLEHPFVKNAAPPERPMPCLEPSETMPSVEGYGHARNLTFFNTKEAAIKNSSNPKLFPAFSDAYVPWNIPSTVSQITSSVLHPLSPRGMSPRPSESPILSPQVSGSSTPVTGGGGAIPFHLSKQPPHEGVGITPRSQKPELFPGPSKAYHIYQEIVQSKTGFSQAVCNCKPL